MNNNKAQNNTCKSTCKKVVDWSLQTNDFLCYNSQVGVLTKSTLTLQLEQRHFFWGIVLSYEFHYCLSDKL